MRQQIINILRRLTLFLGLALIVGFGKANAQCAGTSLNFDGTKRTASITATSGDALSLNSNNFTVSVWLYARDNTSLQNILFHGQGCNNWASWFLGIGGGESNDNPGKLVFGFRSANAAAVNKVVSPANVTLNTWFNATIVYDGASLIMYIDGVAVKTETYQSPYPGVPYNTSDYLYLGKDPGCSGRNFYNGKMDELQIFSSSNGAVTINQWYKQAVTSSHPNYSSLKAYFKFDEGSGTSIASSNDTRTGYIDASLWTVSGPALTVFDNAISSVSANINPLCENATTTLKAHDVTGSNATVTWWTGPGGTGTNKGVGPTLANVGPGTYYARVTGECGPAAEKAITITTGLTSGTIVGPEATVKGCTFSYSSLGAGGGVWKSSNTNVISINGSSGEAVAVGTGTANVTYTTDCNPPYISLKAVTVTDFVFESISADATSICNNSSSTLHALGVTGSQTVKWYSGANATGTLLGQGLDLPISIAQTYYAQATSLCGAVIEKSIVITPKTNLQHGPIVPLDGWVICPGSSTILTVINVTGTNPVVNWYKTVDGNSIFMNSGLKSNLIKSGNYKMVITDDCGFVEETVNVLDDNFTINVERISAVSCSGRSDGSASAKSTSSTDNNIFYNWSAPFSYGSSNYYLHAGRNSVSASYYYSNANGTAVCTVSKTFEVPDATPITTVLTVVNEQSCVENIDGAASVNATGGIPPYTYSWSNSQSSSNFSTYSTGSSLTAGTAYCTVKDISGCTKTSSINIPLKAPIGIALQTTPVSCYGKSDGTATATVSGGTKPYLLYYNDANLKNIDETVYQNLQLSSGAYSFQVKDSKGCKSGPMYTNIPLRIQIDGPPPISVAVKTTNATCFDNSDGTAEVNVTGGNGGYTYQWSGLTATTPKIINLKSGNYTAIVSDRNSCSIQTDISIGQPEKTTVHINPTQAITGSPLTVAISNSKSEVLEWLQNGLVKNKASFQLPATGEIVAGTGTFGLGSSQLSSPSAIAIDKLGNIYVADESNNRVQKFLPGNTTGITIAGSAIGASGSELDKLANPAGVFVDKDGNVYISDRNNARVVKWAPGATSGILVAGGNGSGSNLNQLNNPYGIFVDVTGNIFIADAFNHRVVKWAPGSSWGKLIAGEGVAGNSTYHFDNPKDVFLNGAGEIFVSDGNNHRIQKFPANAYNGYSQGVTVAGVKGVASSNASHLNYPQGIYVDALNNVFIADVVNQRVQKWAPGASSGTTILTEAGYPADVVVDASNNVFEVAFNHTVRQFKPMYERYYTPVEAGNYQARVTTMEGCVSLSNEVKVEDIAFSVSAPTCLALPVSFTVSNPPNIGNALTGGSGMLNKYPTLAIDNITMEAWVKWNGAGGIQTILLNGNTGNAGYALIVSPSNNNQLSLLCGGVNYAHSTKSLTIGKWEHVAVARSAGIWTLYVDGVAYSLSNNTITPNTPANGGFFAGSNHVQSEVFNGSIDEARIWNRALTALEIAAERQPSIIYPQINLKGYWKFDEVTGSTVPDSSSNNVDLLMNTGAVRTTTAIYSWNFDGATGSGINPIYTYTNAGTKTVSLTIADLVSSSTTSKNLVIKNPVGLASITAQSTAICPGATTTLTANGVSGDTLSVTWYTGANGTGTQLGRGLSLANRGTGTYYVRVTGGCGSIEKSITITAVPTVYRSIVSGNWNNVSTWQSSCDSIGWSPATVVPNVSSNTITIQNGHTITVTQNVTIDQTVVQPTGAIAVASGATLTVINNGLLLQSSAIGTASIATTAGTITGDVTIERYIPTGKRAYRQLAGGVNTTNNIYSNWQNGGLATNGKGIHITGSATGANGFDATLSGSPSMFTYTPGAAGFTAIAGTNGTNKLKALQGYRVFIMGDRNANLTIANNTGLGTPNIALNNATTLSATGTVVTGLVTYNKTGATALGATDNTIRLGSHANDFALVANPYWSPVDFGSLSLTDISPTYWLWDPTVGNRGAYVSYSSSTGISSGGNITKDIQPGQAIFIQNKSIANGFTGNPSIVFNEANKTSSFTNTFRSNMQAPGKIVIRLFENTALSTGGTMQDAATVAFSSDFNKAIGDEDAVKFTNTDENIAIDRGGQLLGVEGRPNTIDRDTVAIKLWRLFDNNQYTLQLAASDFDGGMQAILHDKLLKKLQPLHPDGTTNYSFSFNDKDSASFYDRFEIVLQAASLLPVTFTTIHAYKKNSGAQVEWKTENEAGIVRYDVERSADARTFTKAGTVIAANNSVGNYTWYDATPFGGDNYYRVKSIGNNGEVKYTTIVKVNINAANLIVQVYPNPVKGSQFTVDIKNLTKGNYSISLYNSNGQHLYLQQHNTVGGAVTETIRLKQRVAAGLYTFIITTKEGYIYQQKIQFTN